MGHQSFVVIDLLAENHVFGIGVCADAPNEVLFRPGVSQTPRGDGLVEGRSR